MSKAQSKRLKLLFAGDLSDPRLVERAVVYGSYALRDPGQTRASSVMEIFVCGFTAATALCERFGIDPEEAYYDPEETDDENP